MMGSIYYLVNTISRSVGSGACMDGLSKDQSGAKDRNMLSQRTANPRRARAISRLSPVFFPDSQSGQWAKV